MQSLTADELALQAGTSQDVVNGVKVGLEWAGAGAVIGGVVPVLGDGVGAVLGFVAGEVYYTASLYI